MFKDLTIGKMFRSNILKLLKKGIDLKLVFEKQYLPQKLGEQKRKFFRSSFSFKNDDCDDNDDNSPKSENWKLQSDEGECKSEDAKPVTKKANTGDSGRLFDRTPAIFKTLNLENDKTSAVFQVRKDFLLHDLEQGPDKEIEISRYDAVQMYYDMQIIRGLERASSAMYREKIIRGFCHLYTGQEAVAVGMTSVLRPEDNVITAYRCHGWCYVTGTTVEGVLAELSGRSAGVQRGKGGSMHMYNANFYGGNGIVGAQIPLGVGIALASKYKDDGGVCVMCYGDGAANQGQVFEVFNMACLWKLPAIFVCENNMYGMGTSSKRSSCVDTYYTRGDYIPGIWVDGMDIVACRSATKYSMDYVLENGPIVLEMNTYRYTGHSMSDPGTSYRSREEIEEKRKTVDPIATFKQTLLDKKFLTEEEMGLIDKEVKKEVDAATEVAKTSKEIDVAELTTDVYSNNVEPKIRGPIGYNLDHHQLFKGKNVP